jgi:hypothetical protein
VTRFGMRCVAVVGVDQCWGQASSWVSYSLQIGQMWLLQPGVGGWNRRGRGMCLMVCRIVYTTTAVVATTRMVCVIVRSFDTSG